MQTPDFVPLAIGIVATLLGSVRLYGLKQGIVGGADKPIAQKICGT